MTTADDSKWSPRLAAIWDPTGKGTFRVNASYAIYVAAPAEKQVGAGSGAGAPAGFCYYYDGPADQHERRPPLPDPEPGDPGRSSTGSASRRQPVPVAGQHDPRRLRRGPGRQPEDHPGRPRLAERDRVDGRRRRLRRAPLHLPGRGRLPELHRLLRPLHEHGDRPGEGPQYTGNTYDLGLVGNGTGPADAEVLRPPHEHAVAALGFPQHRRVLDLVPHLRQHADGEHRLGPDPASTIFSYPEYHDNAWSAPVGNLPQDQRHRVRALRHVGHPVPEVARTPLPRLPLNASTPASDTEPPRARWRPRAYVTNPGYATPPVERDLLLHRARRFPDGHAERSRPLPELRDQHRAGRDLRPAAGPQRLQRRVDHLERPEPARAGGEHRGQPAGRTTPRSTRSRPFPCRVRPERARTGTTRRTSARRSGSSAYQTPLTFRISMGVRF